MQQLTVKENFSADLNSCQTLIDLLRFRIQQQPDSVAYHFLKDGEDACSTFTYADLDLRARAYAAHLQNLGLEGERAILLYPSGLDFIAAFFGCIYAGVIAVPACPPTNARSVPRLQAIVADADAKLVLSTEATLSKMQQVLDRSQLSLGASCLATDTLSTGASGSWRTPEIAANSLAFLQYTSGSTGTPKGVKISHGNILSNEEMIWNAFQVSSQDVGVGWLPLFHDMGLIGHVLQPVYAGITSVLMSPAAFLQKPVRWLRAISKYGATISGGPNFAYELCLKKVSAEERSTLDLSSWRVAVNGAEPIRNATLKRFAETFSGCGFRYEAFLPCYGLAEATLMVAGGPATLAPAPFSVDGLALENHRVERVLESAPDARCLVGSGKTIPGDLPGRRVEIVNPDTAKRCCAAEIGEIWVSGPHVAGGYWNRTEESSAVFGAYLRGPWEGPFLRTGDLGFIRDGQLVVTGRLKDLIILHGRNLYPQDLEWTVQNSHAALSQGAGAVFSVEVDNEDRLVVVHELGRGTKPDVDEVVGCIRQAVAEAHDVHAHEVVLIKFTSLPKTSSGKVQRRNTRAKYLSDELNVVYAWQAPQELKKSILSDGEKSDLECSAEATVNEGTKGRLPSSNVVRNWLVTEIAEELCVSTTEIETDQPFTYYGLASVEGAALVAKLEEWLGHAVPLSLIWDYPTIDAVAAWVGTLAPADGGSASIVETS